MCILQWKRRRGANRGCHDHRVNPTRPYRVIRHRGARCRNIRRLKRHLPVVVARRASKRPALVDPHPIGAVAVIRRPRGVDERGHPVQTVPAHRDPARPGEAVAQDVAGVGPLGRGEDAVQVVVRPGPRVGGIAGLDALAFAHPGNATAVGGNVLGADVGAGDR